MRILPINDLVYYSVTPLYLNMKFEWQYDRILYRVYREIPEQLSLWGRHLAKRRQFSLGDSRFDIFSKRV